MTQQFYSQVQLILITCGFCICKYAYMLKFICNPQIIFMVFLSPST